MVSTIINKRKKYWKVSQFFLVVLLVISMLTACGSNQPNDQSTDEVDFQGYVTMLTDKRVLVVSPESKDFSASGGVLDYYEAIWLATDQIGELSVGQRVAVRINGELLESYPAQGTAKAIIAYEPVQPEGSSISEAEAIQKAIAQLSNNDNETNIILKGVQFDKQSRSWTIKINETTLKIEG